MIFPYLLSLKICSHLGCVPYLRLSLSQLALSLLVEFEVKNVLHTTELLEISLREGPWVLVRFISHAHIPYQQVQSGWYFLLTGSSQHNIINTVNQCGRDRQ